MGLAAVFKALSDPTRREILRLLAGGERSAGEIAEAFAISKPSISHHLAALRHADLVSDERRGQYIVYSLNTSVLQDAAVWALDVAQGAHAPRAAREGGADGQRDREPDGERDGRPDRRPDGKPDREPEGTREGKPVGEPHGQPAPKEVADDGQLGE